MWKGWICTDPSNPIRYHGKEQNAFCSAIPTCQSILANFDFVFALFTIPGFHLDHCRCCVFPSLHGCRLNLLDSDRNFVIRQPELRSEDRVEISQRSASAHLGLERNTTGSRDYRRDIECWENLIQGRSSYIYSLCDVLWGVGSSRGIANFWFDIDVTFATYATYAVEKQCNIHCPVSKMVVGEGKFQVEWHSVQKAYFY